MSEMKVKKYHENNVQSCLIKKNIYIQSFTYHQRITCKLITCALI